MKKLLSILLILFVSANVFAHCGGCGVGDTKKKDHTHETKKATLVEQLNLTEKQQEEYDKITSMYNKKMKEARKKYNKKIESFLTDEQKEIYKANKSCSLCKVK